VADALAAPAAAAPSWPDRLPGVLRRWWVQVLILFVASRVVSTVMMLAQASILLPADAPHDLVSLSNLWDAEWYHIVAVYGYPAELPLDYRGYVQGNPWAFLPLYPYVVTAVSVVTWLPWEVAAIVVSVLAGAGTALLAYRLFATRFPAAGALAATGILLVNPVSLVTQVAYAESLQLLLLTAALLLLVRRRYWLMLPFVVLVSFSHPTGLAIALAMAGHIAHRWWRHRRGLERFPVPEAVAALVVAAAGMLAGFAWSLIAWAATGVPGAYTETEFSWRASYIGHVPFIPFAPWIQGAIWWGEFVGLPRWAGPFVLLAILVAVAAILLSPWMRRIGPDLRIWVASWLVYLLAVFFPQSSTWRMLLPAYPALGAFAAARSRWVVPVVLALCLVGQWLWIGACWIRIDGDWTPP